MNDDEHVRQWRYGLTADEWFHVACEGENSELPPCCGNIGEIRDLIRELMIFQAPEEFGWRKSAGAQLLRNIEADGNGHDLENPGSFPLLHKIIRGIQGEANLPLLPDPDHLAPAADDPAPDSGGMLR